MPTLSLAAPTVVGITNEQRSIRIVATLRNPFMNIMVSSLLK
jgi:hypothetical protein